ncbi:MAG: sugar phosphate isomerase/epimerase family protein [Blautia sp.]|jgi:sugar phosphate isomerase/epimerase
MKIYLSQLIDNRSLQRLISEYNTGIELIDFSVGMNLDIMETWLASWSRRLKKLGSPPVILHGPFLDLNPVSFEPYVAEAARKRFHQAYKAAVALHADKIIYHTCRVPQTCLLEGWADSLAAFWNDFLRTHSEIPVAVENVFDEDLEAIASFASQVTAPNFSLCLDVGHAHYASAHPVQDWLQVLQPWISHLHFHDNHGVTDEHLAIKAGSLPWDDVFLASSHLLSLDGITLENTSFHDFQKSLNQLRAARL